MNTVIVFFFIIIIKVLVWHFSFYILICKTIDTVICINPGTNNGWYRYLWFAWIEMSVLYERQINCTVVMMPVIVANKETGDSCARRLSRGRERKLVSKWSMNTKLHPTQGLYFRALVAMLYTCTSTSSVNNKGLISDNFSCHWCMCVCVCERDRKCECGGVQVFPPPFCHYCISYPII